MNHRESLAVGFAMAAQGTMAVILGELARHAGLITDSIFVAIVIVAVVTSLLSGPGMQYVLRLRHQRHLADLLTERHFVPWIAAPTVREAIAELSARAAQLISVDAGRISESVWQREQDGHTGLGNDLAVPHARLEGLKKSVVVIGRSEGGIDFDAPDGQPARIICLLLSPADDQRAQIELLAMVARAFASDRDRANALGAHSFNEFIAAIRLPGDAVGPSEA